MKSPRRLLCPLMALAVLAAGCGQPSSTTTSPVSGSPAPNDARAPKIKPNKPAGPSAVADPNAI